MKRMFFMAALVMLLFSGEVFAVSAYPHKIKYPQPDGKTVLTLTMKGDEKVNWAETEDGYTLVYNRNGYFVYATLDQTGDMVPSAFVATEIAERNSQVRAFLENTPKRLRYSRSQIDYMLSLWEIRDSKAKSLDKSNTTGTVRILVIMMQYPNRQFVKTRQQIDNMFNQVNYSAENAIGSVHDYYNEVSYGKLNLVADVVGPYTCDHNSRYYGRSGQGTASQGSEFATEALRKAVSGGADFRRYDSDNNGEVDCVHIIFAGYGRESGGGDSVIWSHKWSASERVVNNNKYAQTYSCSPELQGHSGSVISHIGVACHEIGHVLGAPDFYDVDYESNGEYPGMGSWDIMASGSWGGTPGQSGNSPAHHNLYTKAYIYRWVNVTTLSGYDTVTLRPMSCDSNSFYRINTPTNGEYYLIDNRQKLGFDTSCPGHGLMIYHVHSAIASSYNAGVNYTHPQKLYPVCATAPSDIPFDSASYGNINSTECPFPGSGNRTAFTDFTTPKALSWAGQGCNMPIRQITENNSNHTVSFIYGTFVNITCPTPTDVRVNELTDNYADISWTNRSSATEWEIAYGPVGFDPAISNGRRIIRNISTTSQRISGLSNNDTLYDFYVRAVCGNGDTSSWSSSYATSLMKMPLSGTDSITACGIHIYDNGGPTTNYYDNTTSTLVVKAASAKSKVCISGVLHREDYDELRIYDGKDTNGTLLHRIYTASPRGTLVYDTIRDTSISGALTIVMFADLYSSSDGFDFLVSCIDTAGCDAQPLPYSENFANYTSSAATTSGGDIPFCWTTYSSTTSTGATGAGMQPHVCSTSDYSPYASQSNKYLVMAVRFTNNSGRTYAILPGFEDTLTKSKVSFKVRMGGNGLSASTEILQLGYVANYTGNKATDTVFTPLTTISNVTSGNVAANYNEIALNNYNIPDTARLAFRWMTTRSSGMISYYYCGIDDVNVSSCEGSSQIYVHSCDTAYTWTLNNVTYRTDTVALARITGGSATGCDSLVYLNLKFRQPTVGIHRVRACRSYTWIDSVTYTASTDSPIYHLTNIMGCDSIVHLNLTIQNDTNVIDSVVACGPYTWIDSVTYRTSTTAPTYTYTTSTGCDSIIHLHLTIAPATYGIDSVVACDTFTWINGYTYRMSTSLPQYTLVNAMGCDSIVTLHLSIKHKPTALRLSADRTSIDQGESVTLTASGAVNYLWSTGSTNNPIVEFPTTTTEYYVIGINANSPACKDTASVIITVNSGINDADGFNITVYPNPAQQFITVEGDNLKDLVIYNMLGQKVLQTAAQDGKNDIPLDGFAEGIYTLQVINSDGDRAVRNFVIRKK